MKKHNIFKVVLISLIVVLVLSWIFPAAYFSSEYIDQGRVQMGLSDAFNYFMTSVSYFGHYALYLILVGCFYGVLYKIPAYRKFLDKIVAKVNAKAFIVITVILSALAVSVAGLQIAFAIFIPFIVALILLMGYDKIVAALVVVGSMAAGLVGTTYAYNNNSLLLSVFGLKYDFQIGVRFIVLLVAVAVLLFNIFMYIKHQKGTVKDNAKKAKKVEEKKKDVVVAKKVESPKKKVEAKKTSAKTTKTTPKKTTPKKTTKSTTKKSTRKNVNKAALREEDIIVVKESVVNDTKNDSYLIPTRVEVTHRVWPIFVGFILLFILIVLAWITWGESGFGVAAFDKATEAVTGFELFGFPIFSKIYGNVNAFGNWSVIDLFFPIVLLLVLLTTIYKVKFNDVIDGMVTGAKKALFPAFIVLLLYAILVAVTYHPFQLTIYKWILGLVKGFNVGTTVVTSFLAGVLNIDPSYAYQALLPYYASVVDASNYGLAGVIAQSMYGFTTLFAPTSLILMCTLAYLRVSYKDWLKNTWKILLELFVVLLIIFIILALI